MRFLPGSRGTIATDVRVQDRQTDIQVKEREIEECEKGEKEKVGKEGEKEASREAVAQEKETERDDPI